MRLNGYTWDCKAASTFHIMLVVVVCMVSLYLIEAKVIRSHMEKVISTYTVQVVVRHKAQSKMATIGSPSTMYVAHPLVTTLSINNNVSICATNITINGL